MAEFTKDNMLMTRNQDMAYLLGLMEENTKVIGKMENNMVKEYILIKMAIKEKVFGKLGRKFNGKLKNKFNNENNVRLIILTNFLSF